MLYKIKNITNEYSNKSEKYNKVITFNIKDGISFREITLKPNEYIKIQTSDLGHDILKYRMLGMLSVEVINKSQQVPKGDVTVFLDKVEVKQKEMNLKQEEVNIEQVETKILQETEEQKDIKKKKPFKDNV